VGDIVIIVILNPLRVCLLIWLGDVIFLEAQAKEISNCMSTIMASRSE
jgi:hypothetical protein